MTKIYIVYRAMYHPTGEQLGFGGIENYILSLAQVFKQQGWQTVLVQPAKSPFTITKDHMKIQGVTTGWQRGNLKKYALTNWVKRHANQQQDIIIYATDSYAVSCPGYKTIAIQHGVSWDKPRASNSTIKQFISSLVSHIKYLSYIKKDSSLVCVDHNFVNWYRTWFNLDNANVQVIYNFYQQKIPMLEFESKWAPQDQKIKLIIARRFVDYRGIKLAAPVLKQLLDKHQNLEVTFAGDGPLKSYLEEMFSGNDRVRIGRYGPDECYQWHKEHHIAVVPTLGSEGTSLAMIEAMAAGCAIATTNVGGLTNLIIDQFNGCLIMPQEQALYDALDRMIIDKSYSKQLALNGFNSIELPCSVDHWGQRWVNLINQLTN